MLNVFVCFGEWKSEIGWEFKVDSSRGGRMVAVENGVGVKEFVNMICEEYDLEREEQLFDITYALPEHMLVKLPKDTPPVFIKKDSQLKIFFNMAKIEILRLCVSKREEVKHSPEKKGKHGGDDHDDYPIDELDEHPINDNLIDDEPIHDNSIDDDPIDDGEDDGEDDDDDNDDDGDDGNDDEIEDDNTNVDDSQIVSGTDSTTTNANHTNEENNGGGGETTHQSTSAVDNCEEF